MSGFKNKVRKEKKSREREGTKTKRKKNPECFENLSLLETDGAVRGRVAACS